MNKEGLALIKRANKRIAELREHRRALVAARLGVPSWRVTDQMLDRGA